MKVEKVVIEKKTNVDITSKTKARSTIINKDGFNPYKKKR